jgi:hypothetical protein
MVTSTEPTWTWRPCCSKSFFDIRKKKCRMKPDQLRHDNSKFCNDLYLNMSCIYVQISTAVIICAVIEFIYVTFLYISTVKFPPLSRLYEITNSYLRLLQSIMAFIICWCDRLCGLVVRVLGYRSGGPGSIPGTTRKKKCSGSGTGSTQPREYNWGATW